MLLTISETKPYDPPVEFVERKGVGHPDSLCDALAERLARDLAVHYQQRFGHLRHFNVDKALLMAGQVHVGFGGGEVLQPSRIILAGKADTRDGLPPLGELTRNAYAELGALLPWAQLPGDYDIDIHLNPSSSDLLPLLERGSDATGAPLANDTSFAAASFPRSPLENAVLSIERAIASDDFRERVPVGADVKVMGFRQLNRVQVTVAAAMLARRVPSFEAYCEAKAAVRAEAERVVREAFERDGRALDEISIMVNRADQGPDSVYLTLTGSSAEAGDDGQVGRGNRVGGLITPGRFTSLEAACGKNPVGHVGKLYHAIGLEIADALLLMEPVTSASVRLLSQIGRPIDNPVAVELELSGEIDDEVRRLATDIVHAALLDWRTASRSLIAGRYPLH